jgi:two-component system, OmpR family, phosphate regulon sensor histidine kinase PhoR
MESNNIREERYSVLLVEDDEVDQMAFKMAVKKDNLPYDYAAAVSVAEAADLLKSRTFDIVIVDYKLSDGTAFDVFDIIGDTPRIFITGAGDQEVAIKAMKAGAYDYLVKDHSRNYLKILPGVIKNAINHKRNEDKLKEYHSSLEKLVKERTEQLAKEKELLSVTLSSMSDGVIAVDVDKKIILFNRVAENLLGSSWTAGGGMGKNVNEVLRIVKEGTPAVALRQQDAGVENIIDAVLQTGQSRIGSDQDCLVTGDGRLHPVDVSAAPICENAGNVVGIVVVLRDVTKEREIERMKKDFISSVSHELRTPLTSIMAYIDAILSMPDLPEKSRREYLLIVEEESKRLANLIESILEISRIEAGGIQIVRQDVNVAAVITRVLSALKPLADKRLIRLELDLPAEPVILKADEGKIESVISNLVNNAIKFTPENGTINISVRLQHDQLFISVADTGLGIPRESLPRIFDRFYRVYRQGPKVPGTGLGLAIVKEYVEMHGGRIEVESEEGKGSNFTVILPLAVASPAESAAGGVQQ